MSADTKARAFREAIAEGERALAARDAAAAYAALERAHVIGQRRTGWHIRSHIAFLRWSIRQGDFREFVGQLSRIVAATLFTWLWVPDGNTGGARVSAFRRMPIPDELRRSMDSSRD